MRSRNDFLRRYLVTVAVLVGLFASVSAGAQVTPATVQERLGYPQSARLLVIHADDSGMTHSENRATFEALEKGWITSSSILVPCPWFPEVVQFAKTHPDADFGVHMAVNSEWTGFRWGPVSSVDKVSSLVDAQGYFPPLESDVIAHAKPAEVETELRAQIERARNAGIKISHIDSHMATLIHTPEFVQVYQRLGQEYGLPTLFERSPEVPFALGTQTTPEFLKNAGKQAIVDRVISLDPGVDAKDWLQAYEKLLAPLKPGVYEMIVHLAYDDEEMRGATWDHPNWGAAWRQHDLDVVRNPDFQKFLHDQGFILVKWKDLARALPQTKQ
jgi:predicted glycoside hydrolase/deacetylase ChbG (UPF0249 family)